MTPPTKLSMFSGMPELIRGHNLLIDFANSLQLRPGRNTAITRSINGQMVEARSGSVTIEEGGAQLKEYTVRSVDNDYLICQEVGGSTDVYIAKPHALRKTPWHGVTVSFVHEVDLQTVQITYSYESAVKRSATYRVGGTLLFSENQVIVPRYLPNKSVILATEVTTTLSLAGLPEGVSSDKVEISNRAWTRILD